MKRSNLDEMQEQKLQKLESRGFWLAFWALLAVIIVQEVLTGSLKSLAGELAVFFLLCIYNIVGCLRLGVWDRHLKPNRKTNLIGSALAGVCVAIIHVFVILRNGWGGNWVSVCASCLLSGLFTAGLTFSLMSFTAALYKKRHEKLETE